MKKINIKSFFKAVQILFLAAFITPGLFAQGSYDSSDFNTPPGMVLQPKFNPSDKDMSEIMNELEHKFVAPEDYEVNAKFIKEGLTEKDWESLERDNPGEYVYYSEAKEFYDNLSLKVKTILNTGDLWHIYMFKQDLKEKLLNY